MPTQLTPEELAEIRELFTPPYRTNWQAGQKLFGHIEALNAVIVARDQWADQLTEQYGELIKLLATKFNFTLD